MQIHVVQTGTVAIKLVQRKGRESGIPLLNVLLDPNWTEPLPIYAFMVVTTPEVNYFLAGDASYTQELMLAEQIDGVTNDRKTAQRTLEHVHVFCRSTPTVYLPSHDPETPDRLAIQQLIGESLPYLYKEESYA